MPSPRNRFVALLLGFLFLPAPFVSAQREIVLAWEHPGAAFFRVHIDNQPAIEIPADQATSPYEWVMPRLSGATHRFIVAACNELRICRQISGALTIPMPIAPTKLRAQEATGRIGGTLPIGTASGQGGVLPGPGPILDMLPAASATDVSITPTLSYTSDNATLYAIQFGPVVNGTAQTEQIILENQPLYQPTLAYATTYAWAACAINAVTTVCSDPQTFTTVAAPVSAPSNFTVITPADGATSVGINPTLQWSAANAATYTIKFGTTNPPTVETSLGAATEYATGTLPYNTAHFWQVCATNAAAAACFAVQSFTTRTEPVASGFCVRPCQRIYLTSARKTALSAARVANTPQWVSVKVLADAVPTAEFTDVTTLTQALSSGGAGTTFTVTDASIFPSGANFQVRIDAEILTVSRSSNTLTVVSRANTIYGVPIAAVAHANGAEVWQYANVAGWDFCATYGLSVAVMEHAGLTGYEQRARACLGLLIAAYGGLGQRYSGNFIRSTWYVIPIVYDWVRAHLSANEVSVFGAIIEDHLRWHVENPKYFWDGKSPQRQGTWEAATVANVMSGQVQGTLIDAAALAGDVATAQGYWNEAYRWFNSYLIPAMATGNFYAGNSIEGFAYGQEGVSQAAHILDIIESATGEDTWARVPGWETRAAKFQLYNLQPGGHTRNGGVTTTGTLAATGDTTITVANASTFDVGENVSVDLIVRKGSNAGAITVDAVTDTDVLPASYTPVAADVGACVYFQPLAPPDGFSTGTYCIDSIVNGKWRLNASPAAVGKSTTWWMLHTQYHTVIMDKTGSTLTLRDPAPYYSVANTFVRHQAAGESYGDTETFNNFDDFSLDSNAVNTARAMLVLLPRLNASDPTWAGYLKYLLEETFPLNLNGTTIDELLYWDTTITSVNPFAASLPTTYSTAASAAASGSTGFLIGRSNWTATATRAHFLVGSESSGRAFDHSTNYFNSYKFKRKGVTLTDNLRGYGVTSLKPSAQLPWTTAQDAECLTAVWGNCAGAIRANAYVGWRYHNTVSIKGSASTVISGCNPYGPAVLSRSDMQTTHLYGRGDADGPYRFHNEVSMCAGDTTVRTFQRDFLYILPDLVAFADHIAISDTAVKPTRWYAQFPGDPSVTGTRISMTYSTQKLVQDVVLPSGVTFAETNHDTTTDKYLTGYSLEMRSGNASAVSSENFCSVLQGMDSGDSPVAVTTLTTTNACVVEVAVNTSCPNGCVIAFVRGTTPTLPIEYTYTAAAPDHYVYGLAASTAYHITRATKTVTIVAATGTGDTTSSASGRLAVP